MQRSGGGSRMQHRRQDRQPTPVGPLAGVLRDELSRIEEHVRQLEADTSQPSPALEELRRKQETLQAGIRAAEGN